MTPQKKKLSQKPSNDGGRASFFLTYGTATSYIKQAIEWLV